MDYFIDCYYYCNDDDDDEKISDYRWKEEKKEKGLRQTDL